MSNHNNTNPGDTLPGFIKDSYTSGLKQLYHNKPYGTIRENIHSALLPNLRKNLSAHINGYYFIYMKNGPWLEHALSLIGKVDDRLGFPISKGDPYDRAIDSFGTICKEIQYTSPMLEYDQISGKAKNLVQVSKETIINDFTITISDTFGMDFLFYYTLWHKYIAALKKGYIKPPDNTSGDKFQTFYDVPFHNLIYVVQMDAAFHIKGLTKIMGVTPISTPINEYLGKRGEATHTHVNYRFKLIDMFQNLIYSDSDLSNSDLMKEFEQDFKFKGGHN